MRIIFDGGLSPVRGWEQHAGEGAGCLLGYWKAVADELHPSDGRMTVELHKKKQDDRVSSEDL